MEVLIVEDERMAAARLQNLLREYDETISVAGTADSVKSAANWLLANPRPDLIFLDIQLGDGTSFEIFELVKVQSPVVFITAYNEYALQAFKVNSIDYLLKPLDKQALFQALDKYRSLHAQTAPKPVFPELNLDVLKQLVNSYGTAYKNRFLIKVGEHLKAVQVTDILYFFSRDKGTFVQTNTGKRYLLDHTLDEVEQMLDPQQFFRINRQYLVNATAITDMVNYTNSRLKLLLPNVEDGKEVLVSREKVAAFKSWLDR